MLCLYQSLLFMILSTNRREQPVVRYLFRTYADLDFNGYSIFHYTGDAARFSNEPANT